MKQLVVTADDFGLAAEVNEAVEIAHRQGILSAASLMVGGAAAADAIARAKRMPNLRVGLHIVLVEGAPLSPPERIATLVDGSGCLRRNMVRLGMNIAFNPATRAQLAVEIEAQFSAFAATGLPLDHVNAHKHFHLHPIITNTIISIGKRYGMKGLRVPHEPRHVLAKIEKTAHSMAWMSGPYSRNLGIKAKRAGLQTAESVFGLAWSGAMNADRVAGLLRVLPNGRNEIYFHPATSDTFAGAAPGYRYTDELAALIAPDVIALARASDISLGGYAEF